MHISVIITGSSDSVVLLIISKILGQVVYSNIQDLVLANIYIHVQAITNDNLCFLNWPMWLGVDIIYILSNKIVL